MIKEGLHLVLRNKVQTFIKRNYFYTEDTKSDQFG